MPCGRFSRMPNYMSLYTTITPNFTGLKFSEKLDDIFSNYEKFRKKFAGVENPLLKSETLHYRNLPQKAQDLADRTVSDFCYLKTLNENFTGTGTSGIPARSELQNRIYEVFDTLKGNGTRYWSQNNGRKGRLATGAKLLDNILSDNRYDRIIKNDIMTRELAKSIIETLENHSYLQKKLRSQPDSEINQEYKLLAGKLDEFKKRYDPYTIEPMKQETSTESRIPLRTERTRILANQGGFLDIKDIADTISKAYEKTKEGIKNLIYSTERKKELIDPYAPGEAKWTVEDIQNYNTAQKEKANHEEKRTLDEGILKERGIDRAYRSLKYQSESQNKQKRKKWLKYTATSAAIAMALALGVLEYKCSKESNNKSGRKAAISEFARQSKPAYPKNHSDDEIMAGILRKDAKSEATKESRAEGMQEYDNNARGIIFPAFAQNKTTGEKYALKAFEDNSLPAGCYDFHQNEKSGKNLEGLEVVLERPGDGKAAAKSLFNQCIDAGDYFELWHQARKRLTEEESAKLACKNKFEYRKYPSVKYGITGDREDRPLIPPPIGQRIGPEEGTVQRKKQSRIPAETGIAPKIPESTYTQPKLEMPGCAEEATKSGYTKITKFAVVTDDIRQATEKKQVDNLSDIFRDKRAYHSLERTLEEGVHQNNRVDYRINNEPNELDIILDAFGNEYRKKIVRMQKGNGEFVKFYYEGDIRGDNAFEISGDFRSTDQQISGIAAKDPTDGLYKPIDIRPGRGPGAGISIESWAWERMTDRQKRDWVKKNLKPQYGIGVIRIFDNERNANMTDRILIYQSPLVDSKIPKCEQGDFVIFMKTQQQWNGGNGGQQGQGGPGHNGGPPGPGEPC
jgi:hypothetical protein